MNAHKELQKILDSNKDGSYSTQASRSAILHQFVNEMHEAGYKDFDPRKMGSRHIEKAIERYEERGLSEKTKANKIAQTRWLARKTNRENVVQRKNKDLRINKRSGIAKTDKSSELPPQEIRDKFSEREQLSLELQREFGLRPEESLKLRPSYADKDDHIVLKGSWTKGGRERKIEVRTDSQRELLNKCHEVAGKGSMIANERSYKQAIQGITRKANENNFKMYSHRHAYAHQRYKELTGREAPIKNIDKPINDKLDHLARLQISKELGHNRKEVSNSYLGSSS